MPSSCRSFVALVCIICLVIPSGCASHRLPPPPSEETRARFGTIGVVTSRFLPDVEFRLPAKGKLAGAGRGAAMGSAAGAVAPFMVGASGGAGNPYYVFILLAASVVGATVGGVTGTVIGAAQAEPAEKVTSSESQLRAALANLKLQESLHDCLVQAAECKVGARLSPVAGLGPASPEEKAVYTDFAGKGIDTVVEVSVTDIGLDGPWDVNPPIAFFMRAHVRVVRTSDGTQVYDASFRYRGNAHTFSEWAADGAAPFQAELDRACRFLAEKAVEEIFMLHLLPTGEEPLQ